VKGVVFNLLGEVVSDVHGEDLWDDLLDDAGLDGSYTSLGSYPDVDFLALVGAASARLEVPADDVVRWFGREATPRFRGLYPAFFEPHDSTRGFVLTLNQIIHPEVRKVYPGADVPVFDFDSSDEDLLRMGYSSARKMCAFAEGLLLGAGDVFGEEVVIDQPLCMNRGDDHCLLEIGAVRR
jgi:hypothetical protein